MLKKKPNLTRYSLCFLGLIILFALKIPCYAQNTAEKIDALIQTYVDCSQFNGTALVAVKGEVIFKKGYGLANREWNIPNRPNTKFRLGSITKQFTSMLVLQLVEQGRIDLQGNLSHYLPYYRKDTGEQVTIHHLLTHSSGIPSYTSLPDFFAEISRDPYPVQDFVVEYCSGDLEFEPGSKYRYNNSGYFLLGAIIEEVTGKKYEDVLQERILDPLGMKDTGYDHHETIIPNRATGYNTTFDGYLNSPYLDMSLPYAAGSLYSTVEDLFTWDQALYTDKLLSEKFKQMLFKSYISNYGYGWSIRERKLPDSEQKLKSISHGGGINGFNTLIERLIDEQHLVVLLNNAPGANLNQMSDSVIKILYDRPYSLPKRSIADVIYKTLNEEGVQSALQQYETLKKEQPKEYDFGANELNNLGYYLLNGKNRVEDAIEIFKFNIQLYPKYANGYDSLAEAYMKAGNTKQAIKNYAKALEMDPNNVNALDRLNELIKK